MCPSLISSASSRSSLSKRRVWASPSSSTQCLKMSLGFVVLFAEVVGALSTPLVAWYGRPLFVGLYIGGFDRVSSAQINLPNLLVVFLCEFRFIRTTVVDRVDSDARH